jgi:hypothetical protein
VKIWDDLTKANDKYVGKDVRQTLTFFGGLSILIGSAIASAFGITVDKEAGVMLLFLSFGLQGAKGAELYFNRKLDVAASTGEPVMNPEPETPTVAVAATATVVSETE